MEITKRKERVGRRPLYLRAFAIIMAVFMVLSVVYISHRKDKVEAAVDVNITDDSYLSGLGLDASQALDKNTFVVNVPANGIKFLTPATTGFSSTETEDVTVYKYTKDEDTSVVKYKKEQEDEEGYTFDSEVAAKLTKTTTAAWSGVDGEGYVVSNGTVETKLTATTKYAYTFASDGSPVPDVSMSDSAADKAKITIKTFEIADIGKSGENASQNLAFTDSNAGLASSGEKLYGAIEYTLAKDGTNVLTDQKALSSINNYFDSSQGIEKEGKYVVTKTVTLEDGSDLPEGSGVKTSDELLRNYIIVKDFYATVDTTTFPNSAGTVTIPASGFLNPKKAITGTIVADGEATIAFSSTNTNARVPDAANTTGGTATFTIPGDQPDNIKNNGETVPITITVTDKSDANVKKTLTLNIKYGDGTPTLSGLKINGASGDTKQVGDSTVSLGITAKTGDGSGALITKAELYKVSSTSAAVSGSPVSSNDYGTAASVNVSFEGVALEPGNNYFKIKAYSDYGISAVSDAFTVFMDDAAPVVTKASITQTVNSSYGGSNLTPSGTTITVPNKITCMEASAIELKISDKQTNNSDGSGINSVTVNGSTCTISGDTATYTLPANATDTNKAGVSYSLSVVVTDKAGKSSTYYITGNYFNEDMTITQAYTPSDEVENGGKKFFKWTGADKKGILEYTVESEVELSGATITINSASEAATQKSKTEASGKYTYVYKYEFDDTTSNEYTIDFTATNINNNSKSAEQQIKSVDITNPDDVAVAEDDDLWHSSLTLNVTTSDSGVSSGIDTVEATGTDQSSYTPGSDGKFTAKVNDSETSAGTTVTFKAKDKAGNISSVYTDTFKVDGKDPTATLTIGGLDSASVSGVLSEDPTIVYSATDNGASGIASISFTATDGSTSINCTDDSKSGKSLSTILGVALDATKTYTVTFTATDNAGNSVTKSATFKVDGQDPDITGSIANTAKKSTFPTVFDQDVTVNVTIVDYNLDQSKIVVSGTGSDKATVSWTPTANGYTGVITASTEGVYALTVTATDKGGRVGTWSVSFTIDKTAPVLTPMINNEAYSGTSGYFNAAVTTSVGVSDANEDTTDVTAVISRTAFDGTVTTETKSGKGPFELSEEGTYSITYTATDKAGISSSASIGLTVDKTSPVPKINITTKYPKIAGYYNADSVDMSLEISDPTVIPSNIEVTDNGKTVNVTWTSGDGKLTAPYSSTSEEKHTIIVKVKDLSGNEATASEAFLIDRTKPRLTTKVNSKEYTDKDKYFSTNTFSSVVVSDKNEDEKDVTLTVRFSGYDNNESIETKTGKGPFKFTKQGKYELTYKAVDKAGNERSKTIGFYIDKSKPVGNMYIKTDKPAKFKQFNATYSNKVGKFKSRKDQEHYKYGQYYNTSVSIEFNYFDYDIDQITISDGDEELIPEWSEKNGFGKGTVSVSGQGHHVIKMELEDKAGNITKYKSGTKVLDFYIDKTAPSVVTSVNGSSGTDGISMNSSGTVGVSVIDTYKDPDDLTRTARITAPGGGTTVSSAKVREGSESFANEADYEIEYVAVDKAGNKSVPKSVKFRVDRSAPQLSITSDAKNGASTTAVDVTFNIKEPFYNDMTSSKIEVYKKVDGARESHVKTIDFMPRSSNDTKTDKFEDDGEYRFVFTATDKAGNNASENYSFILDGSKPVITLSGVKNYDKTEKNVELGIQVDETFYLTNKVTLSGTKTDIDGKTTDIDFENFPASSAKIATLKQIFKEDGVYDITVSSVDKAGNKDTKTIHFTIDTKPPVIESLDEYDGKKVKEFKLEKSLDELVTDLTVCEVKLYMDGVEYDGVSALADGTHVFRIEATDEMGHKSVKEFTFVLDTMAPNIIVTGAEDGAYLKDATIVEVSVELDDDYIDYVKVNGEAVAVSDNKCQINVDKRGKYTIEAAASDDAGNKSSLDMTFHYGNKLIWLIIGGAVILIGALIAFLIAAKRRKDDR